MSAQSKLILAALFLPFIALSRAPSASAQVLFTGSDYFQDFNGLSASGSGHDWNDGITLGGWHSSQTSYNASTGSSTSGGLYSFGSSSDSDRALGSLASGSAATIQFGLRLRNGLLEPVSSFTLTYEGEQWRAGGSTAENNSLSFSYLVGGSSLADSGYISVPSLNFDSLTDAGPAGAMNGNADANRSMISGTVSGINWEPGTDLWLRWTDINDGGSDHGLSVDNLNFSAVPEPEEYGLVAGLALLAYAMWRKSAGTAG